MPFPDDIAALAERVSNWGRWGDDDQLGTLNLIDEAARLRGLAAAVEGRAFSLALPWSADGPQMGFVPGRDNPEVTAWSFPASFGEPDDFMWHDDRVSMGTQSCTHWDGLGHASYGGKIYNGFDDSAITEAGAAKCGIHLVDTLVSRGVLLDLARAADVDRLPGGHATTAEELDAAVEHAGVTIEPGDVLLLRTGHMQYFHEGDRMTYATSAAGPSLQSVEWFHRHDIAALAIDNLIFEVFPSERDDIQTLPVHFLHIVDMGLTQGQNWDLEALAADCAADGRYTFLLSAAPEPVLNGIGAPVHPTAIK